MKSDWNKIFPFDQVETAQAVATHMEPEPVGAAH
jgi:hypothetical protein